MSENLSRITGGTAYDADRCAICRARCRDIGFEQRCHLQAAMGAADLIGTKGADEKLLQMLYEAHRRLAQAIERCDRR